MRSLHRLLIPDTRGRAAGGALTAKRAPRRPGTAPAPGLRAEEGSIMGSQADPPTRGDYHVPWSAILEDRPSSTGGPTGPGETPSHAALPPAAGSARGPPGPRRARLEWE